ncbi:MAG: hypothetical protein LBC88_05270 [Spirochaetaceae bacterium]|nr:hypothetical protein [Spirochaetaceae bacterium]
MKYTFICVLFNVIVAAFLLLIGTLPFAVLGAETARNFLFSTWPLGLALLSLVIMINIFFALNFRLYRLLERMDWPALAAHLEDRMRKRGKPSTRLTLTLIHTYLALSAFDSLRALMERIAGEKPALLEEHALLFGAARLLAGDYAPAERFFAEQSARRAGTRRKRPRVETGWLSWYRALALFMERRYGEAADIFCDFSSPAGGAPRISRAERSPWAMITGLSSWFLGHFLAPALREKQAELSAAAETGRALTRRALPTRSAWEKNAARYGDDAHVLILSQYVTEAAAWLYVSEGEL